LFGAATVSLENASPCLDDKQFGLGMLALAAFLKSRASRPSCSCSSRVGARPDGGAGRIRNPATRPGVFAIGLNWLHFSRGAIQFAQLLKRAVSDALIVIGGQHATLFADALVEFAPDTIDAVICGERSCRSMTFAAATSPAQD